MPHTTTCFNDLTDITYTGIGNPYCRLVNRQVGKHIRAQAYWHIHRQVRRTVANVTRQITQHIVEQIDEADSS